MLVAPLYVPGRAGLLGVRVGGGPPASRPRSELRSARRLEARPGPATAHAHRSQAPRPAIVTCHRVLARRPSNFACNSPLAISNFEFISLELQRFQMFLKLHSIELRAIFAECWPCRPRAPRPGRACGTKFSLLGLLVARAVQSSPCWRQMPQNRRFSVCWESFVPGGPLAWVCWESFVSVRPARAANRESFVPGRRIRCAGPVSRNHRNHCGLPVCCRQASDVVT